MDSQAINVQSFAAKFRSKRGKSTIILTRSEVYTFLTVDGEVYLPPFECVTIYHLKAILAGTKNYVRQSAIRHVSVPQCKCHSMLTAAVIDEGLSVEKMLLFLDQFKPMHQTLPDQRQEILKLPRQYIINVAATVVGDPFLEFIKNAITNRNTQVTKEKDLLIKCDPQLAQAFNNSTAVSRKFNL